MKPSNAEKSLTDLLEGLSSESMQPGVSTGAPIPITHDELEEKLKKVQEDMVRKMSEKIDLQIQKTQDSFLTIFGIFGSVLSLLTIVFQFFQKELPVMQVAGLSLLLFALLLGFVLALDYVITNRFEPKSWYRVILVGLIFASFVIGLSLLYFYQH